MADGDQIQVIKLCRDHRTKQDNASFSKEATSQGTPTPKANPEDPTAEPMSGYPRYLSALDVKG